MFPSFSDGSEATSVIINQSGTVSSPPSPNIWLETVFMVAFEEKKGGKRK